jgi:hypothetical protein
MKILLSHLNRKFFPHQQFILFKNSSLTKKNLKLRSTNPNSNKKNYYDPSVKRNLNLRIVWKKQHIMRLFIPGNNLLKFKIGQIKPILKQARKNHLIPQPPQKL